MFHYTMSGLDNVWLANGYTIKKTKYGEAVSIHGADQLNEVIACDLVKKKSRLTGKEFRFLRTALKMSQGGMAQVLGVTEQSVSLWERTGKVPKTADSMTRLVYLAKHHGDMSISKAIDRINTVERICHQRFVLTEGKSGWKSKVEVLPDEKLAA